MTTDRNVDENWKLLARTFPYYAVLAHERYRKKTLRPEDRRTFFDSGKADIEWGLHMIRRHIDPDFRPSLGMDFGCGPGRLLIPMAQVCDRAVGIDVSDEMLRLCRENLALAGLENCSLHGAIEEASERAFDWINSVFVFPHIPPDRGYAVLDDLLARLAPGGTISLHFLYECPPAAEECSGQAEDPQELAVRDPLKLMPMFSYDLNTVVRLLARKGILSFHAFHKGSGGWNGLQVLGQKLRAGEGGSGEDHGSSKESRSASP